MYTSRSTGATPRAWEKVCCAAGPRVLQAHCEMGPSFITVTKSLQYIAH